MSPNFWGCRCCGEEQPPTSVDSPCSGVPMVGCVQTCVDGTGISLVSNPFGGSSAVSADPVWGRPGPGLKIVATQSGDDGCFTLLQFDDPLPHHFNCARIEICGEFQNKSSANTIRIWPVIIHDGNVYVRSEAGSTSITSPASWKGVWARFNPVAISGEDGRMVTGYDSSGVTASSSTVPFYEEIYAGFLIQSIGTDGEDCEFHLDNACVSQSVRCPGPLCHVAYVPLSGFETSGDWDYTVSGITDPDCHIDDSVHSLTNGLLNDTWMIPYAEKLLNSYYWANGSSPTEIYSSGGEHVRLRISISIPTLENGTLDTSGISILQIILQFSRDGCAAGIMEIGRWAYHLDMADLVCGAAMDYSFYSYTGLFELSQPDTVPVTFEET